MRVCAEIWSPVTGEWTVDASAAEARTYHSSALLVPDGRVFVGGGGFCGACGVNHQNAEMYSPPYLFNADGTAAARPTITLGTSSAGVPCDPCCILTVTECSVFLTILFLRQPISGHGHVLQGEGVTKRCFCQLDVCAAQETEG